MILENSSAFKMADDIDELLDEVESKFIHGDGRVPETSSSVSTVKRINADGTEELDAAIHSICSIPEPVETSSIAPDVSLNLNKGTNRKCTVVYVGDSAAASGLSGGVTQRRGVQRRQKHSSSTRIFTKKYFAKPVFELSVKDLEAESARRKQKEIIERLFDKKLAVVTDKMVLDVRKFKRIKSDVWSNFGDVRLLISEEEVKKFNIDHHVIHIGKEEVLLCKSFVACVKCSAVFSYESHSYGTSTLRSHLKSCGRHRNRDKTKKPRRMTGSLSDVGRIEAYEAPDKPVFQEQMLKFRDHATKMQEQILLFFISKLKPFSLLENLEFKDLLQTFIQIGATAGNVDLKNYLCSPNDLIEFLVNDVFVQCEEAFKNETQFLYGLSFSASIWVDIVEKISYLTLSCHYANADGLFKSVKFHTTEFPYEQRTSDDLVQIFQSCLSKMQPDFKKLLVIDYSFNMVNTFNNNELFIQCICYALNCAVQTVINAMSTVDEKEVDEEDKGNISDDTEDPYAFACFVSLINQCRSLVLHFKENKLQSSLPKNLQMCSSTSWKAVLSMLESINSQWDHIVDILLDRNELELFYFDHELLSIVVDFLEIFRDGYQELSSLINPTLNLVLPWVTKWKTHCLTNSEDESPFLAALKSFMGSSIDTEVVKRITMHHKLATMLDPRFKDLHFLSEDDKRDTQAQAEYLVRECHETLLMNGIDIHNSVSANDHFAELYDNSNEGEVHLSPSDEVREYLAENFTMGKFDLDIDNKFNPLQYWIRAKTLYPYLSRVALWILSCPASAIQVDDCFVLNDWMITTHESDLPRKHMNKCLFVKSFKSFHSK